LSKRSKVAVLRTEPGSVLDDIARLAELAGIGSALDSGSETILKDNISWHYPFPGANTTPWQLEGTILALNKAGFRDLIALHNNTVVTDPVKGGRLNRLAPVYRKYGIREVYNCRPGEVNWRPYEPKFELLALDKVFPRGILIPDVMIGRNVVHLPTMKCHIYTTTTGSMKNAFGGLLNTRRHYTHSFIHQTLVDLLAIQKEIHPGIFTIMDGTVAGDGAGPRTMRPVEANLLLAGSDSVAVDAVAAKIMGFDPMTIDYIRIAHERGLGNGRIQEIDIVGDGIDSLNLGFKVGNNLASLAGNLLWFGPLKFLQYFLFRTPVVYAFVFASYLYHDLVWWPLKGKRIKKRMDSRPWGRLFNSYPED